MQRKKLLLKILSSNVSFLNIYLFPIIIRAIFCDPWPNVFFFLNKCTILCELHGCWPIQFNCACVLHLQNFILVVLCTPLKSCRMGFQRFKQLKGTATWDDILTNQAMLAQLCCAVHIYSIKSCRAGLDNFKPVQSFGLRYSSGCFSKERACDCFISFLYIAKYFIYYSCHSIGY